MQPPPRRPPASPQASAPPRLRRTSTTPPLTLALGRNLTRPVVVVVAAVLLLALVVLLAPLPGRPGTAPTSRRHLRRHRRHRHAPTLQQSWDWGFAVDEMFEPPADASLLPRELAAQTHELTAAERAAPFPPFQRGQPWWDELTAPSITSALPPPPHQDTPSSPLSTTTTMTTTATPAELFARLRERAAQTRTDRFLSNVHARSGFNNQRTSFVYGLLLSICLNRTFIPAHFTNWPGSRAMRLGRSVPIESVFDLPNLQRVARVTRSQAAADLMRHKPAPLVGFREAHLMRLTELRDLNAGLAEAEYVYARVGWGFYYSQLDWLEPAPVVAEARFALRFLRYRAAIQDAALGVMAGVGRHFKAVHMRVGDHETTPGVWCNARAGLAVSQESRCVRLSDGAPVSMLSVVASGVRRGDTLYIATNDPDCARVARLRHLMGVLGVQTLTMADVVRADGARGGGAGAAGLGEELGRLRESVFPPVLGIVDQLVAVGADTFFSTCPSTLSSFAVTLRLFTARPHARRDFGAYAAYVRDRNALWTDSGIA